MTAQHSILLGLALIALAVIAAFALLALIAAYTLRRRATAPPSWPRMLAEPTYFRQAMIRIFQARGYAVVHWREHRDPIERQVREVVFVLRRGGAFYAALCGRWVIPITSEVISRLNLALGQAASVSSTLVHAMNPQPSDAVDGNTDGNFFAGSVTHTTNQSQPWWQVDLGGVRLIEAVELWNRTDCCADRLSNFYVFVSNVPFTSGTVAGTLAQPGVSAYYFAGQAPVSTKVSVGRLGRYVRVQLTGTNPLSLAEVRVLGPRASVASYYYAGGQRIAQRVVTTTTSAGVLYYLHGDHLGSTSLVTCGSGCGTAGAVVSRQLYHPFGTVRHVSGVLPTDYTFTGQMADETGLMYFRARFYDAYLNRWIQPDSIVPEAGNPQALNRYAFSLSNPLKYTDPSGHKECEAVGSNPCGWTAPKTYAELRTRLLRQFGVRLSGDWSLEDAVMAEVGVLLVGSALAGVTGGSAGAAFSTIYGATTNNPILFEHVDYGCTEGCWGWAINSHHVRFYGPSTGNLSAMLVAHELGHAFNGQITNYLGKELAPYDDLAVMWGSDSTFPRRNSDPNGFAGPFGTWQQSRGVSVNEEFADMFLGWVFGQWDNTVAGATRGHWMTTNMAEWITMATIDDTGSSRNAHIYGRLVAAHTP